MAETGGERVSASECGGGQRTGGGAPAFPGSRNPEPLTVGDYFVMFLLFSIPLVNLIVMIAWGFGGGVNANRRNFARAALIILLVGFALAAAAGGGAVLLLNRSGLLTGEFPAF